LSPRRSEARSISSIKADAPGPLHAPKKASRTFCMFRPYRLHQALRLSPRATKPARTAW
jgi:hypothetical protein